MPPPGGPMDQALVNAIAGGGGAGPMGGPPGMGDGPPPGGGDPIDQVIAMLQKGQIGPAIEILMQLKGALSGGGPGGPPPGPPGGGELPPGM